MSTLEKTITLLNELTEDKVEVIYSYVQFLISQQNTVSQSRKEEPVGDILKELTGCLPDSGKTVEEYRAERIQERYGFN
ncbi:MAG TPA: hypothetical protein H9761_06030 [Candidatus Eisenbergiella merdavium]|uniref:DUF2281 domain-containing protein n=1 Tax=Candidatus Eisenbergiella merdavium TaxID=2838551 RepID=A0A9D2NF83_9FIRM|nr:hypothetical protein [Candidatus Eisenbergiella merdavium]